MQKRTIYSLLLTSLILVFVFSTGFAQEVTFESKTVLRCQSGTLNITVNTPDAISALELVFEISGDYSSFNVQWDLDFVDPVLPDRDIVIDGNVVRMWAMQIPATSDCLGAGETVVAQVNFESAEICDGLVEITGTQIVMPAPSTVVVETWFADCVTSALVPVVVNPGTITINDAPPEIDPIVDVDIHWGSTYYGTATADDDDLHTTPGNCEELEFYKVSGPTALIVSKAGAISWPTTGDDVCENIVAIEVIDGCDVADTTEFTICVYNDPPEITCPADTVILWGEVFTGNITATDDGGPAPLAFSRVSFDGPGSFIVNADGSFEWETDATPDYIGTYELCAAVTDGGNICEDCSPKNADTCCFTIEVRGYQVTIDKVEMVIQGQIWPDTIFAYLTEEIGGFDLLVKYDESALLVNSVTEGELITDCEWEYFTYRYGPNGNCGPNACPSGMLRIVAIAETNNGDYHPVEDCIPGETSLAVMHFLVSNDRTLECQYVPVRFYWYDCGDNALSDITGDTLLISRSVYDYSWNAEYGDWINIAQADDYPTYYGAQECDFENPDKVPFRWVDFRNGGIDIACAEDIDARGDVNLNEIGYEVADVVLFSQYFVYGAGVFVINPDGQIAATDANADGIVLSVADLVYMIRVVIGDANAYPKTVVPVNASYVQTSAGVISVDADVEMGAALVVASGDLEPELLANDMDMIYNYDGVNTRILVYSINGESFTGEFLRG